MAIQGERYGLQVMRSCWSQLQHGTQALLLVGAASSACLLFPQARPELDFLVHVCVVGAGITIFRDVLRAGTSPTWGSGISQPVRLGVRTLELASSVLGLLVVMRLV